MIICYVCDGSGEGYTDGTICVTCRGVGSMEEYQEADETIEGSLLLSLF